MLEQARAPSDGAERARGNLIRRYQGAAYRYLLAAVRNLDLADDLFQEFALRVMQGRFRGADAKAGRFRDYLKSSLYRLVIDHFRSRPKQQTSVDPNELPESTWETSPELSDECFLKSWRDELLARAWQDLEQYEQTRHQPYYTALKLQTNHEEWTSEQQAQHLSEILQRYPSYTATAYRKLVQRARLQFAQMLVNDIAQSLENPRREDVEQELIALDLHKYCRRVL